MTGSILKVLNIYPTTTLNSHLWVYFKCAQFFTTGHIVITLVLGQLAQDTNPCWFSNQYCMSDSRYTPKLYSCHWNRRASDVWLNSRTYANLSL